jgi:hypothetical protein
MNTPSLELQTVAAEPLSHVLRPPDRLERDRLIRRTKALSWLSLAYMSAEGAIAITAAAIAGSVALLGFGLDSMIEGLASVIVIWRFTGSRRVSEQAEERAQRLVAITFFLLAPYIAQDSIRALIAGDRAGISWLGIGLSLASILVMPMLGRAKRSLGQRLGSGATAGEGTQNMLCAFMAAGVLLGLVANAAFGLWWIDPAVALGIAALAVNEGRQTWAGDTCCSGLPIPAGDDRATYRRRRCFFRAGRRPRASRAGAWLRTGLIEPVGMTVALPPRRGEPTATSTGLGR